MQKHVIVITLAMVFCLSASIPIEAEAGVFLAALPAVWAATTGIFAVAVVKDTSQNQKEARVRDTSKAPAVQTPPEDSVTVLSKAFIYK